MKALLDTNIVLDYLLARVQVASAIEVGADVIITRDPNDMTASTVRVISPKAFVAELLL